MISWKWEKSTGMITYCTKWELYVFMNDYNVIRI